MPPKRARMRAAQTQFVHSDYDTDNANFTDNPSAPAPPPLRTNEELNLTVLQRHNPEVLQILSVAPFTVIYLFSPETQQWEKCGVEGTLFVCQLVPAEIPGSSTVVERYNVTVLNRKGLENFSTDLLSGADVEITEQYVILQVTAQDGTPQIFGLWIFSEPPPSSTAQTRVINAQIIQECANRAESSRQLAEEEAAAQAAVTPRDDYQDEQGYHTGNGLSSDGQGGALVGQQLNADALFGHRQFSGYEDAQGYPPQQQYPQQMHSLPRSAAQYQNAPPAQPDVLLDLFRNARQGPSL